MIPKIINYCWFGGNSLGEREKRCIESWKKFLPGWQIVEWNESNFDIEMNAYIKEAYKEKKWAFVSDVARLAILSKYGGLYLDTDVEIVATLDEIIGLGAFMGIESASENCVKVNPGLITAAEPNNPIIKVILETYKNDHFIINGKNTSKYTIVERTTDILKERFRLQNTNSFQRLDGICIYPKEYFCPIDYATGKVNRTNNTKTIHWFTASWLTEIQKKRHENCRKLNGYLPGKLGKTIGYIYTKLGAIKDIYIEKGVEGVLQRIKR